MRPAAIRWSQPDEIEPRRRRMVAIHAVATYHAGGNSIAVDVMGKELSVPISAHFWTPGATGKKITDEGIAQVEQELGFKLPDLLLSVLRVQNGGSPRNDAILLKPSELTNTAFEGVVKISLYALEEIRGQTGDLWNSPVGMEVPRTSTDGKVSLCVIGVTVIGADMLCLDYRRCGPTGDPAVILVEPAGNLSKIQHVSGNCAEFFSRLFRYDEYDCYCIEGGSADGEQIWHVLLKHFDIQERQRSSITGDNQKAYYGVQVRWKVSLAPSLTKSAVFHLAPNIERPRFGAFPTEPADHWLLRVEVAPEHRQEIETLLHATGLRWKAMYFMNWNIVNPAAVGASSSEAGR